MSFFGSDKDSSSSGGDSSGDTFSFAAVGSIVDDLTAKKPQIPSIQTYARLEVVQLDADNLLAADSNGLSDPYFTFRVVKNITTFPATPTDFEPAAKLRVTSVIEEQRTDLHWDTRGEVSFDLRRHDVFHHWLHAEAWDEDSVTDDFLGEAFFPLHLLFLGGSTTSVPGAASQPRTFTLPLHMPASRLSSNLAEQIELNKRTHTDPRALCGTITLHVVTTCPSFIGDALSHGAASLANAQSLMPGGGNLRSEAGMAFDALLHAIHTNTLSLYLAAPGSCAQLRTTLLACLTLRDRGHVRDSALVDARTMTSALPTIADTLFEKEQKERARKAWFEYRPDDDDGDAGEEKREKTMSATSAAAASAPTFFAPSAVGSTLSSSSLPRAVTMTAPAPSAQTTSATTSKPAPKAKAVDWFAYDAIEDHEEEEVAPLPKTIGFSGAVPLSAFPTESSLQPAQVSTSSPPSSSLTSSTSNLSIFQSIDQPGAPVRFHAPAPVISASTTTSAVTFTLLSSVASSRSSSPFCPGLSSSSSSSSSSFSSSTSSNLPGVIASATAVVERTTPNPATIRAWQVCWSLYQKRALHAFSIQPLSKLIITEIQAELSEMLQSRAFVEAICQLLFYQHEPTLGFSPVHVADFLYSMLRLDDPAFCNRHLLSLVMTQPAAILSRLLVLLLDSSSTSSSSTSFSSTTTASSSSISLVHRAYALIPFISFYFSHGEYVSLPANDQILAASSATDSQIAVPFDVVTLRDLARMAIIQENDVESVLLSALANQAISKFITPFVLSILQDSVVCKYRSVTKRQALTNFLYLYHQANAHLFSTSVQPSGDESDSKYEASDSKPSLRRLSSMSSPGPQIASYFWLLAALVFHSEFKLHRLPVKLEWKSCSTSSEESCDVSDVKLDDSGQPDLGQAVGTPVHSESKHDAADATKALESRTSLFNLEYQPSNLPCYQSSSQQQSFSSKSKSRSDKFRLIVTPIESFSNVDIGLVSFPNRAYCDTASLDPSSIPASLALHPRPFYITHIIIRQPPRDSKLYSYRLRSIAIYASLRSLRDEPEFANQTQSDWASFLQQKELCSQSMPDVRPVLCLDLDDHDYVEEVMPEPVLSTHITLKLNAGGLARSPTQIAVQSISFVGYFDSDSGATRLPVSALTEILGAGAVAQILNL